MKSRDIFLKDNRENKTVSSAKTKTYRKLTAEGVKYEGPNTSYQEAYELIRPDSQERLIQDQGDLVYDEKWQHFGYTGTAYDITCHWLSSQMSLQSIASFPTSSKKRYYLYGHYKNVYLTLREAECAFYLLQGKTIKQMAKILQLSFRTVESIMLNIKHKLRVHYKPELFEALIQGNFVKSIYA